MSPKQSYAPAFLSMMFFILILAYSHGLALPFQKANASEDVPIFDVDYFNRASDDLKFSHLDLYIRTVYDKLQFVKKSRDKFSAQYEVSISIFDTAGKFVDSQKIKEQVIAHSFTETNSTEKFSLRKIGFDLPPGDYEIKLDLKDLETQKKAEYKISVSLTDYSIDEILSSELLFLSKYSIDQEAIVSIEPRVSETRISGTNLFAYVEVYNIPENDSLLIQYEVENKKNMTFEADEYWTKSTGERTLNIIEIHSKNLPHGQYVTKIKFSGKDFSLKVEGTFNWYVDGVPLVFDDLDQAIEVLQYIASEEEFKDLKTTPQDKKQDAFIDFWKKHDPTPETAQNELRKEYYTRVQFANEHYRRAKRAGWKTDMGWVYVVLGAPDAIDRNPFNSRGAFRPGKTIKAAELWTYYKFNRQFLFLDELGFGDYRLNNPDTLYEIIN